jgi:hypothetical protein
MGKTSLLRELLRRYQEDFIGLFLDLQGDDAPEDVIVKLANAMKQYQPLHAKLLATPRDLWNGIVSLIKPSDRIQLRETINAGNWAPKGDALFGLLAELEKPIILCLDEIPIFINRLINREQLSVVELFMSWLRSASEHSSQRFSVILSGSIGFAPILERINMSAAINIFIPHRLNPWEKVTAVDFLRGVARHDVLHYEEGAEDILIDTLRCCIPHHVQLLHQELREHCIRNEIKIISRGLAGEACERLINSGKGGAEFRHYEERLRIAHSEKVFNAACIILAETAQNPPQQWERLEKICRQKGLSEAETRMLLTSLTEDGYLEITVDGVRFFSPLLQRWWKKQYAHGIRNG